MSARRPVRVLCATIVLGVLIAPIPANAQEQGDYTGTYGGMATTSKQWKVPIVAYVTDKGTEMDLTIVVRGYDVPITAEESWSSTGSVTIAPTVDIFIANGSGTATFSDSGGSKWVALGSGSGQVYNLFKGEWISGSAQGSAERLSPVIDEKLGETWIKDHPEEAPPGSPEAKKQEKRRKKAAAAVALNRASTPLAPNQLPLTAVDRFKILFVILFFMLLSMVVTRIIGKPWGTERTADFDAATTDVAELRPSEGGAKQ